MQQNCKVPQHSRAISKRSSTLPFTVQSVRLENGKIRTEKRAQTYFLFISMIASRPVRPDGLCMAEQPIATNGKWAFELDRPIRFGVILQASIWRG